MIWTDQHHQKKMGLPGSILSLEYLATVQMVTIYTATCLISGCEHVPYLNVSP